MNGQQKFAVKNSNSKQMKVVEIVEIIRNFGTFSQQIVERLTRKVFLYISWSVTQNWSITHQQLRYYRLSDWHQYWKFDTETLHVYFQWQNWDKVAVSYTETIFLLIFLFWGKTWNFLFFVCICIDSYKFESILDIITIYHQRASNMHVTFPLRYWHVRAKYWLKQPANSSIAHLYYYNWTQQWWGGPLHVENNSINGFIYESRCIGLGYQMEILTCSETPSNACVLVQL